MNYLLASRYLKRTVVLALACIAWPQVSLAQKTTEVYIPIGESPGVSGTKSVSGKVQRMDYERRSIDVSVQNRTMTLYVGDDTVYYLDRSAARKKNSTGGMRDCKPGMLIEAVADADGKVTWVKVKVE